MSGVILLIGAFAIAGKGINFGIDFESGTRIKTPLNESASVDDVRNSLGSLGLADAKIQKVDDPDLGKNVFQISTATLEPQRVERGARALDEDFGVRRADFSSSSIGPTFGQQIARTAIIAIIASLFLISLYIGLRFEFKFAVPVLIALFHDILITSGVYALVGREVTTATVAALLTILGYSLYDTIIVFDRIRENVPRMPRATFSQIVNRSMSEVVVRSLVTSLSVLFPILALLLLGGETLQDFAFALLVGVASGAYSSIFIAAPVLTEWKEREPVYQRRRRVVMEDHGGVIPPYAETSLGDVDEGAEEPRRPSRPGPRQRRAARTRAPSARPRARRDDRSRGLGRRAAGRGAMVEEPMAAERSPSPGRRPRRRQPEPAPSRAATGAADEPPARRRGQAEEAAPGPASPQEAREEVAPWQWSCG